jgi:hypothetical protein
MGSPSKKDLVKADFQHTPKTKEDRGNRCETNELFGHRFTIRVHCHTSNCANDSINMQSNENELHENSSFIGHLLPF